MRLFDESFIFSSASLQLFRFCEGSSEVITPRAEATLTALHQQKRVWQIDTVTTNPARIPPISAVKPRSEFGAGAGIFPLRWSGLQVGRGTAMGQNLEMKVPGAKISPSMLSSDFANLASEAKFIEECGADWLHMDIMDGHYVPNLTIGAPVIKSLRKHTKMFMDCHLMVTNPMDYVDDFVKAGASGFTFHVEVSKDNWQKLVHKIKAGGMRAGVALRPGTPIEEVFPLVESEEPVDMVLVMTVEPGFGGQSFMPETMPKVNALRRKFPHLDIEVAVDILSTIRSKVDGGLSPATIKQAADAGANCIVAGSAVFGAKDPAAVITTLRKGVDDAQASSVFFK